MKSHTAKFLVALAILTPLAFFFGAVNSDPKTGGGPFGPSAAAWAQAIGSVGAICVAIYAVREPFLAVARERARTAIAFLDTIEHACERWIQPLRLLRLAEIQGSTAYMIAAVELHKARQRDSFDELIGLGILHWPDLALYGQARHLVEQLEELVGLGRDFPGTDDDLNTADWEWFRTLVTHTEWYER